MRIESIVDCCYNSAVDVTSLVIGVTVALGVGIIILLIAIAMYAKTRRRVEYLRQQMERSNKIRRRTSTTTRVRLSDDVLEILRERRRAAAMNELAGFD